MTQSPEGSLDGGLDEIRRQVAAVVAGATAPGSKERLAELSKIQWFLAAENGRAVGLKGAFASLVPLEKAQVFDGRDNEALKKAFFVALLKTPLFIVPIEACPRNISSSEQ
jgi:hypothetical protein